MMPSEQHGGQHPEARIRAVGLQREPAAEHRADDVLALRADVPEIGAKAIGEADGDQRERRCLDEDFLQRPGIAERLDAHRPERPRCGERPISQMTKPAIRNAVMKAATGASARIRPRDTEARGVSSNRMDGLARLARRRAFRGRPPPWSIRRRVSTGSNCPWWITAIRSAISNSSSRSWLTTTTALPCAGEIDQRLPDQARRAGIDAPGRLVDDEQLRACG